MMLSLSVPSRRHRAPPPRLSNPQQLPRPRQQARRLSPRAQLNNGQHRSRRIATGRLSRRRPNAQSHRPNNRRATRPRQPGLLVRQARQRSPPPQRRAARHPATSQKARRHALRAIRRNRLAVPLQHACKLCRTSRRRSQVGLPVNLKRHGPLPPQAVPLSSHRSLRPARYARVTTMQTGARLRRSPIAPGWARPLERLPLPLPLPLRPPRRYQRSRHQSLRRNRSPRPPPHLPQCRLPHRPQVHQPPPPPRPRPTTCASSTRSALLTPMHLIARALHRSSRLRPGPAATSIACRTALVAGAASPARTGLNRQRFSRRGRRPRTFGA